MIEELGLYNLKKVGLECDVKNPWGWLPKDCFGGLYAPLEKGNNSMPLEIDRTPKKQLARNVPSGSLCFSNSSFVNTTRQNTSSIILLHQYYFT